MSWHQRFFAGLDRASDWLSPIVVKEVRQLTGGREFHYSFAISLLLGLCVAFFGAADALGASGTSGRWTFGALIGCLTFFGLVVVPLGAFNALRTERLEQTLELITLTALSPRRVVIGKLLAQGVKLATLFAGLSPFIAMSFLLGGIDFVTILVSMLMLFLGSLWACAASLFLSSLVKTRAISGLIFGGIGVLLFLGVVLLGLPQVLFFMMVRGGGLGFGPGTFTFFGSPAQWWMLVMLASLCLVSMMNLVLLTENRLSVPTENRVTPLRIGFAVQFLVLVGWMLSFVGEPPQVRVPAALALGVLGGLHLAIVAMFTLTEDLVLPRRVLMRMHAWSPLRQMLAVLSPGGGRGALYVLAQMAILLVAVRMLKPSTPGMSWFVAICAYICFFTGVPVAVFRLFRPAGESAFQLRVLTLVLLPVAMLLPDILYYMLWRPDSFDVSFATRHLISPRALAHWSVVEAKYGLAFPVALGLIGVAAYSIVIGAGMRMIEESEIEARGSAAPAREPDSADVY